MIVEIWSNFFIAIASASATLTGLIFVGLSFNLKTILSIPKLSSRASETVLLLTTLLITSSLCLIPNHPAFLIGIEFLCIGVSIWIITLKLDISMLHWASTENKKHFRLNILLTQLSVLPYIASGIIILSKGYAGIYWFIPGIIFSFVKTVLDAWVFLVEINR
jgi:modulator of FtsH protease